MNRALEAISRRLYRLLLLLLLLPLVSLVIVYVLVPRTYQAQTSLWALHRYAVIGATGPESNLQATPADTQVAAVQELLQTREFALNIAHVADVAPTLSLSASVRSDPGKLDDALFTEISHNVAVVSQGYDLYTVSYANRSPQVAQRVVAQIVSDFSSQSTQFSNNEAQVLLTAYQAQLVKAQGDVQQAAAAETKYLAAHPGLSAQELATDPQYQALHAATAQAQNNVQNIQEQIATIQQQITAQGSGSSGLFIQMDAPHVLNQPVSRAKLYLTVGGVALAVAVLACTIYLLIILRRDRSLYTPLDVRKVTTLPVLMQLPNLPAAAVLHLKQVDSLLEE